MINTWTEYYQRTRNRPPAPLLVQALSFVRNRGFALDLGAGSLKDSRFLVNEGFKKVIAVDKEAVSKELLADLFTDRFKFIHSSFEDYSFPVAEFDLINAQYSLPFNPPSIFKKTFKKVINSLASGGIFVGQFLGVKDEWNELGTNMSFYTAEEVKNLLKDMEVLEFKEEERDGKLASGTPKHWHVFHIIARKIARKN